MKRSLLILAALAALAAPKARSASVDFTKDVAPILEQRCLECHGPKKQKGKLRLDQKDFVFNHSELIVLPGKADESPLVKLISLPKDHDDIMPNKGEPLTKAQIDLIRTWINDGASWPDGFVVGAAPESPAAAAGGTTASDLRAAAADLRAAATRLEAAAASLEGGKPAKREPTPEELAALAKAAAAETNSIAEIEKNSNVTVRPIAMNSDLKEANFRVQGTNITDASLQPLSKVFRLVDLNLAATSITDAGLAHLKNLTNLTTLHLENTAVTDQGLAHLKNLSKLDYLNLYNTAITDQGLQHLKGLTTLKKLYLWETKVTDNGVSQIQATLPNLQISRGVDLALVRKIEEEKKAREEVKKKEDEEKKAKAEAEKKAKEAAEAKAKEEAEAKAKAEEAAKKKAEDDKQPKEDAAKKAGDQQAKDATEKQ